MKRLPAFALSFALLSSSAASVFPATAEAAPASSAAAISGRTNSGDLPLNVRRWPNASSKVLGKLQHGSPIRVLGLSDGWAEIQYGGSSGYVSASRVLLGNRINDYYSYFYSTSGTKPLNVRSAPSDKAPIVGKLPDKARIKVLVLGKRWARVIYKGKEAYAASAYLTPSDV